MILKLIGKFISLFLKINTLKAEINPASSSLIFLSIILKLFHQYNFT